MERGHKTWPAVVTVVAAMLVLAMGCSSSKSTTSGAGTTIAGDSTGTTTGGRSDTTSADAGTTPSTSEGSTTTAEPPEGDTSEQAYVAAFEQGFAADEEFPTDKAGCAARAMVDAIGVDTFVQNGVSPDDLVDESNEGADLEFDFALTEQQARDLVDGFDECVDLGELMAQSFADDSDITDEQKACLERELTSDVVKDFMVDVLVAPRDDPDAGFEVFEEIFAAMAGCGLDPLSSLEDG